MLALGLISGTSADGVSLALINFKENRVRLVRAKTYPYSPSLRERVLQARFAAVQEISRLNFELGEFFAQSALKMLKQLGMTNKDVRVIGSHGQTIYHGAHDSVRNTFQIGEPAIIAERTGIPVVADFRPRDIAAGGEGAPLTPFFEWLVYHEQAPLLTLNIGGISNLTLIAKNREKVMGFDTGPGNCLLDLALRVKTKGKLLYDRGGSLAYRGRVEVSKIKKALKHPYFKRKPPKSTGRELFCEGFIKKYFGNFRKTSLENISATLGFFTAVTIAQACENFILKKYPVSKLIVSGGGANNVFILSQLEKLLKTAVIHGQKPIQVIAEDRWDSQAKEPMAFALMALEAIQGRPNHIPNATGAKHARILGCIYPVQKS